MLGRIARGLRRRIGNLVRPARTAVARARNRVRAALAPLSGDLAAMPVVFATLARAALRRAARTIASDPRVPRRLRVGVDILPFYEPLTGVGWYLRELLDELARRDEIELVPFGDPALHDHGPHLHVELPGGLRVSSFDLRGLPGGRRLAIAAHPLLVWLEGCDLFFGANYFLPRTVSAVARHRVVTVHDFTWKRYPDLLQKETLANLDRHMPGEIACADAIVCVSEATRADLLELYEIEPGRAFAIHSGIPDVASTAAPVDDLPSRFVLFVSTVEPRKNLDTLITAFESLRHDGRWDGDLVVVGRIGWKAEGVAHRMKTSRWSASIHHLDYLSRPQLATVYARAEIFVLPSHYEGFGFPLLEAMAHGVPSIAARTSSLPEVGGDAAIYFDPSNAAELADCIAELVADEEARRRMSDAGRARAGEFRWNRTASETLAVFRRVGGLQ